MLKKFLILIKKLKSKQEKGLKILTPNQMLSRLPITLAQLKQEIILKNLKMKLDNYYIFCTDKKTYKTTI